MERIPKVVRERLQAGMPAGIHPDANILAAFAERSLMDRERVSVLEHLARCRGCRDVVALALPEFEPTTAIPLPPRVGWMTWPAFRWGFAMAGVAIIALGIVQYQRHSRPSMMARQISRPQAVDLQQPAGLSQPSPSAPRAESTRSEGAKLLTKIPSANGLARMQPSATPAVNQFHGSRHSISGATHGPNMPVQWQQQQQQVASRVQAFAPVPSTRQQASNAAGAVQSPQMLAVQSKAAAASGGPAANDVSPALPPNAPTEQMFDNLSSPVIWKAKPATVQGVTASSFPRWSITSTGELQRSFDQGNTWESVEVNASSAMATNFARSADADAAVVDARANQKDADKKTKPAAPVFRAVVANGSDVWAGGTNGALYHSIDAGNRWTRIIPSVNGSVLAADIVALQFSDPQHGTVTTSTPDVWSTSDGGQTWQKQ